MKTFEITLKGHDPQRSDSAPLVKRVNSPDREALDRFLIAQGLRRWLDAEPDETPFCQQSAGVDAALNEEGNVAWTADTYGPMANGLSLARRWREAVCLAAVRRQPQEASVLLAELIELIDATGGLTTDDQGTEVPVADEWPDLAVLYTDACCLVQIPPQQEEENDDA